MRATPDTARWNAAMMALHWLSALAIVGLLALGLYMVYGVGNPAVRFDLYQIHKSIGFIALALLLARTLARLATSTPPPLSGKAWERHAGTAMHVALYVLTLVATMSGWITASATIIPVPIRFFRTFVIPNIARPDAALEKQMSLVHTAATWSLGVLVALHVAAALKHHLVDRDDTLRRMTPRLFSTR